MEPKIRTREFPADCLPPEGEFESRDALFAAINAWAALRGYAFTTGRSTRKKAKGRPTVTYTCDRAGRPGAHRGKGDKPMEQKRQTSTRITGCQFSINAKQDPEGANWHVKHRPGSQFAVHNHEPSQYISAHPTLRSLSISDETTISDLIQAGIAPRDIRTYLRQNSSSAGAATQQDISNCIAKSKRALCEGQSTIQALADGPCQTIFFRYGRYQHSKSAPRGHSSRRKVEDDVEGGHVRLDEEYRELLWNRELSDEFLEDFGPELVELGRDIWKVQADALAKAPFIRETKSVLE